MRIGVWFLAGCLISTAAAGCAARRPAPPTTAADAPNAPAPLAAHDPDDPTYFTLDQILPTPELPAPKPRATTGPAPLDALQWFAQARAALATSQRQTAINLLEKAASLDPDSPEVWEELGKAYGSQDKAIPAYEKSLALDPDNLALHEKLGRQYLVKNKPTEALLHLRLALKTTEYREDEAAAAVVDFFLARALQRKGYDRAALDQYARLVKRLDSPTLQIRQNPELMSLLSQPEVLYGQIGELYEKHKEYGEAVRAYELAAERQPDSFEFQSRLTKAMALAGQRDDAEKRAQELVSRFKASPDSLKLLREVYQQTGRGDRVVDALATLRKDRPADQALLFAHADALKQSGRVADAEKLLFDAARASDDDGEIVRRLFAMYDERDDVEGAVRLLVNALAENPDSLRQLSPMWAELLKASRRNRLRLPLLQNLKVEPSAEASRLFWVSRVADVWNRDALARSAIEQGATLAPAFPPIYRALVADYWSRPDWDEKQKADTSQKLADTARSQGNPALAAELEGLSLLRQKGQANAAAGKIAQSIQLGNKAPDVQLTQAIALRQSGDAAKSESQLWKVVSDTPTYEDAYAELFGLYAEQKQPQKAINVLSKWLSADPSNVHARVLRSQLMRQSGRTELAESELNALFRDNPDSPEIFGAMYNFYAESNRIEEYIGKLEDHRRKHPEDRQAAEQLVLIYHDQKRLPEALRVLDASRDAVARDPDLLYYVAHVYGRIGQRETESKLLENVIDLDPRHAPAANDLGYTWADEGRNLARAEDLIRIAVDAEPDNQSFLDSLGWVLYKRGKFAEAKTYFEKAIGPATRPDPVVLDHMGDVLYRLSVESKSRLSDLAAEKQRVTGDSNQPPARVTEIDARMQDARRQHEETAVQAAKQWKRAQERLDQTLSEREDLKKLRLQLMQKLRQQEKGQPVDVAPIAEAQPPSAQAKN